MENEIYKIVMGKFNGTDMIGDDQNVYRVNPNYASKSRLVEGDELKLTVFTNGDMVYKQVNMADRIKFIATVTGEKGTIVQDDSGREYIISFSTARFFNLKPGDEVACLTAVKSSFAVVDSVVTRNTQQEKELEL